MTRYYKVVPAVERDQDEIVQALREHLASNINVGITDNDLERAAVFQEYLDTVDRLVEQSRSAADGHTGSGSGAGRSD